MFRSQIDQGQTGRRTWRVLSSPKTQFSAILLILKKESWYSFEIHFRMEIYCVITKYLFHVAQTCCIIAEPKKTRLKIENLLRFVNFLCILVYGIKLSGKFYINQVMLSRNSNENNIILTKLFLQLVHLYLWSSRFHPPAGFWLTSERF